MVHIFPEAERRRRVLPRFVRTALRYAHSNGEAYTTDGVEGVALWLPPGRTKLSFSGMVRSVMILGPFITGLPAAMRFNGLMTTLERLHHEHMTQPHWYLMVLGVEPERQNQGVGTALVGPILERADRDGLPCYLETMTESNVRFYGGRGFEVVVHDSLPKGGLEYWTMRRPPRTR